MMLLVLSYLLLSSVSVSGSNSVVFSGFIENGTYYTNGDAVTELTCNTTYNDVIIANRTWFYERSGSEEDTGSSVIRFEDVVNESPSVWGETRMYYCRAVYEDQNNVTMLVRSGNITLIVQYNTSITISYSTVAHVLYSMGTHSMAIPVMTQNVELSCGVVSAKWSYFSKLESSPITISLFTIENDASYYCRDESRFVRSITLFAIGSGIWQLEGSSYTEKADNEVITLREDVSLVCVSTDRSSGLTWNFRGESNTGMEERVTDNTEFNINRGFLTLNISQSLPANRTGYYYCLTRERRDSSMELFSIEHSIKVVLPTEMTTPMLTAKPITTTTTVVVTQVKTTPRTTPSPLTPSPTTSSPITPSPTTPAPTTSSPITSSPTTHSPTTSSPTTSSPTTHSPTTSSPTIPSLSLSFSYTPEFEVVFVGVDDVTLLCVASSMTSSYLSVSIRDEGSGEEVISETGSGDLRVEFRVRSYTAGLLTYTCVTNISTEERSVTIDARGVYEQEIANLLLFDASGRLEWNTAFDTTAGELFIVSVNSLNESTGWKEVARTNDTFYILEMLIPGNHYEIRVRVTNRLNATNSFIISYVVPTQSSAQPINASTILIPVIVLLALAVLILLLVSVLLVGLVVWRRRRRSNQSYSKAVETELSLEISEPSPYVNLPADNVSSNNMKLPVLPRKKPVYEKLQIADLTADSTADNVEMDRLGYMSIDELGVGKEKNGGSSECEIPVNETTRTEYLNLSDTLYLSTGGKYANDTNATLVPLAGYKHHLSYLLQEGRMEKEYRDLGGQKLRYDCNAAVDSVNEGKNKYKLIYPYDRSRVMVCNETGSDYINASFIPGFHVSNTFIAAQAPKSSTVASFWEMIRDQHVTTVVMLTRVVELGKEKCASYWPKHAGASEEYGSITVELQREVQFGGYATRDFMVTGSADGPVKVTQYHFTAWPDHDVPQLYNNLLEFIHLVKTRVKKDKFPILVHCSAGVGRSGTFIALYNLMESVSNDEAISVYRIVNEMREYRPQMVQTFGQYRFIHLALLELIFGSTVIPSEDFSDTYKLFLQSQGEDYTDVFQEQFDELDYQSENSFTYPVTAADLPQNSDKNPVKGVLPFDDKRVILYSPNWDCEYVNASYIDGYDLIAAPLPTKGSIQVFLQLIYQLEDPVVVVLASKEEYHRIREGNTHRVCYWLEEDGMKDYEGFTVKTEKSQKSSIIIQQKMKVLSNYDKEERSFTQFISLAWEENGSVVDSLAILNLLSQITLQKQNSSRRNLMICCSDGIGKTGVLLTVYRAIAGVQSSGSVDVFQIVKELRNARRRMVPSIEHYLSCYSLINEYCQMNL